MNRAPQYPEAAQPGVPQWRRWWLALLWLWALQTVVLLTLWPADQTQVELWLCSAVLPLCWALALALRVLGWQIGLFDRGVYQRFVEAALQRWWRQRSLGLPVQEVLLIGPVGDVQTQYQGLMAGVLVPKPVMLRDATQPRFCCPFSLNKATTREPLLARHLARMTLQLPDWSERGTLLRGIAWTGDEDSRIAFSKTLSEGGVVLPEARMPLNDLRDLDVLIDAFHHDCHDEDDWLLCAGVVSVQGTEATEVPGEAGFVWLVSRQGRQLLHRSEYRLDDTDATSIELCAQVQRYACLDSAPPTCLALDQASQNAFVDGGWTAAEHQLAGHWGMLGQIAPFIGMSLALLQAGMSRQPCGWLSQDGEKRMAIGMAVPHGND